MGKEIWKDVKEYEGYYQISNKGNIRSLGRYVTDSNKVQFINGKQLKPFDSGKGYLKINLCKDGVRKSKFIHRLVCETFLKKYNEKFVVNHKDFNTANNNLNNLELLTQKENIHYSLNNGNYGNLFFSQDKDNVINEIKELNKSGTTKTKICEKFKIDMRTLNNHIPGLKNYGTTNMELKGQKVMCVDTGEVFDKIKYANEKYGVTTIGACCRGVQKTAAGFKWEYVK